MNRLHSALLLGGAVLLTSYINAPAAPTAAPARVSSADIGTIDAVKPFVDDVAQETERLRARLVVAPQTPVARRDPFSFGGGTRPVAPAPTATPDVVDPVEALPAIVWPTFVALLTDRDATGERTAVLEIGGAVEILTAGTTVGGFLIREITPTSVEIVHVATSTSSRLALR